METTKYLSVEEWKNNTVLLSCREIVLIVNIGTMTEQELHRLTWTNIKTLITVCKVDPSYSCTNGPTPRIFLSCVSRFSISTGKFPWACNLLSLFILFFLRLFIYFWLCCVFVAVCGLSPVGASRGYSPLRCMGFSLWGLLRHGAQALGQQASVAAARRLSSCSSGAVECWLRSCGTRA